MGTSDPATLRIRAEQRAIVKAIQQQTELAPEIDQLSVEIDVKE